MNTIIANTHMIRIVKTVTNALSTKLVLEVFDGHDSMNVVRWREPEEFDQDLAQELMKMVDKMAEAMRDPKPVTADTENEVDNDIPF